MQEESGARELTRQQMWDDRHAAREPIEAREPDATLVEEAGRLSPGRALDLGAGDGRNAVWLAREGWDVTAVDFSAVALDRARDLAGRAGVSVDWQLRDLLTWAPPARAFDLVCLVFIQLPEDERRVVYARAAEAVAPGGSLLVVAHHPDNLANGAPGPRDPAVLFGAGDLAPYLAGLQVVRAGTIDRPLEDGVVAVDAVLRAVRPEG